MGKQYLGIFRSIKLEGHLSQLYTYIAAIQSIKNENRPIIAIQATSQILIPNIFLFNIFRRKILDKKTVMNLLQFAKILSYQKIEQYTP